MHSIRPSAIQMKRFEKREIQETEVLPRQTIIFCDNNDFCVKTQRGKGKGGAGGGGGGERPHNTLPTHARLLWN